MTTIVERLEQEHGCWTNEYWLCHSNGFRVESDEGRLGYVEEVVWAPDGSEPHALRVRARCGEGGVVIVRVEDVLEVRPKAERILVRSASRTSLRAEPPASPPRDREGPATPRGRICATTRS